MAAAGRAEEEQFRGGSYLQIHRLPHELPGRESESPNERRLECHHLIPQECLKKTGLNPELGPAIQMTVKDHMQTETWGRWDRAKAAKAKIDEMLRDDDFDGAMARDIRDIRGHFGTRYDAAIGEANDWYDEWRSMHRSEVEFETERGGPRAHDVRIDPSTAPQGVAQMTLDEILEDSLQRARQRIEEMRADTREGQDQSAVEAPTLPQTPQGERPSRPDVDEEPPTPNPLRARAEEARRLLNL